MKIIIGDLAKKGLDDIFYYNMQYSLKNAINTDLAITEHIKTLADAPYIGRYIPEISKEEWAIYNSTPEKFAAESVESVFWRIKSFFDEQFSRKENVLVVAHGGTLRILSYYLSNRDTFIREVYESKYKDAKQATNTALFEINPNLTFMKPIYY